MNVSSGGSRFRAPISATLPGFTIPESTIIRSGIPQASPSGNAWGMPLRMIVDSGMVKPGNVALIGARNLDPPEETFIAESGIHTGPDAVDRALEDCSCVYVAFDVDSLDPVSYTHLTLPTSDLV